MICSFLWVGRLRFEAFRKVFQRFLVEMDVEADAFEFHGLEEGAGKPEITGFAAGAGGVCQGSRVQHGGEEGAHAGYCGGGVFVGFVCFFVCEWGVEFWFFRFFRFDAGRGVFVAAEVFYCGFEELRQLQHVHFVGRAVASFPLAPLLGADAEVFCAALTAGTAGVVLHPAIFDVAGDGFTEGLRDSGHDGFPCRPKEKRRRCFSRRPAGTQTRNLDHTRHPRTPPQNREGGFERACVVSPWFRVTVWVSLGRRTFALNYSWRLCKGFVYTFSL